MKSFKVLTLLTLAAALSCGANGSPVINATTDSGFIKRQNKDELAAVRKSLSSTLSKTWNDNHQNVCAEFDLFSYYDCILHTRRQILPKLL
ncbi:hypothetical protein JOM56_004510 [Amanita muscaria]